MNEELDINLGNLSSPMGSRKTRVRRGRGIGSGLGKTAGRGGKGQTARAGKGRPKGFEGGQMPLYRRLPKFGFNNPLRKFFDVTNVDKLEIHFRAGDTIDPTTLHAKGLVKKGVYIKILGEGKLSKKFTVKAHKFSKSALQKINQAGGVVEELKIAGEKEEEKKESKKGKVE